MINRVSSKYLLNTKLLMRFGGGGHHKVYDWREDHLANPDYIQDPRMIGVKPSQEYQYPYKSEQKEVFSLSHPDNFDPKNLNTNYTGVHDWGTIADSNNRQTGSTQYLADIAHEYDYESQDFDFQPESFKSQHFRKKGPIWMWIIAGFAPMWFFGGQLFFQYWPDEDNWRYQRPPPLNYPDDAETPDTQYFEMFQSDQHKDFYDAGIVNAPFFTIKDGKKIYTKWAGVNQPREPI